VNAVHGADVNTGSVLGVDARFGNHVSHTKSPLAGRKPEPP
jgi:hypothetical protein